MKPEIIINVKIQSLIKQVDVLSTALRAASRSLRKLGKAYPRRAWAKVVRRKK